MITKITFLSKSYFEDHFCGLQMCLILKRKFVFSKSRTFEDHKNISKCCVFQINDLCPFFVEFVGPGVGGKSLGVRGAVFFVYFFSYSLVIL